VAGRRSLRLRELLAPRRLRAAFPGSDDRSIRAGWTRLSHPVRATKSSLRRYMFIQGANHASRHFDADRDHTRAQRLRAGRRGSLTYPPPGSSPEAGAPTVSASPEPTSDTPATETLEIEAFDLGFKPASLEVPAAGRYEVKLVNTGAAPHDVTFPSGEVATARPGETASVEIDTPAAGTTLLCSIPGHADAGMSGQVTVAGAAAPSHKPDGQAVRRRRQVSSQIRTRPQRSASTRRRLRHWRARSTTSTSSWRSRR
jgi:plastocyanin